MKRPTPIRLLSFFVLAAGSLSFSNIACGQDPFLEGPPPEIADGVHRPMITQVGILVEWVEMDARAANKLVRKHLTQAGPAALPNALRDEVEKLLDAEGAKLLDTSYVITKSGQRAKVESVDKKIYATEYEPPELANTTLLFGATQKSTPAMPTAFDVRNVGATMEVDPVIGADEHLIDLNIAPELVEFVGRDYVTREGSKNEEIADVWMPQFYTMRVATALTVRDGESQLASLQKPRTEGKLVLVFVQANVLH